jgi:hypothetical protein
MAWVLKKYHRPQIEYQKGGTGRIIRPTGNYDLTDPYGSHVGRDLADAALALMLDYPLDDKMPALISYIQGGIDRFHCHVLGQNWGSGGGYQPNCRLPLVFAAIMLDNQAMKDSVRHTDFFDDNMIHLSDKGAIIFGSAGYASERTYWDYLISPPSYNLERLDPYGYIDCGMNRVMLSDGYQECCLSMPWKGTAAAAYIMPELRAVFDDSVFLAYVDRWVTVGTWTQPDPCAPAEGIWHGGPNHGKRCTAAQDLPGDDDTCFIDESKYGVTYGPDGNGGCIKDADLSDGIGRFPNRHGLKKNTGYYGSAFIDTMYGRFGHAAVSTAPHRLSHQGPGSLPRMMISSRNSGREVTIRIKAATGTGAVMLDIVDPRGRSVRRFAAEPAFSYATVVWDYRNTHGARIPAGMFIVRALSGDSEAAEMLIVGK